ncbi:hypothetical protein ACH5RR_030261 [Cinchona calisaya]|uniref:GCF C-terminal domain-containing protein n=1 Tax=Cinchona calisaya TaxID=153742 RepID=A0ABD2YU31_9GENT
MSSKARNFRRRGGDDANDDYEDNDRSNKPTTTTTSAKTQSKSVTAATKPKKTVTPVPKSRLSFADDEDADYDADQLPIKPRPSSSTSRLSRPPSSSSHHKLSSSKERIKPQTTSSSLPSNVQPQAGTYTKEALLELQKNTRTLAPSRPARPEPPKPETKAIEPVILLKGLVKPKPNIIDDPYGEIENDEMGFEKRSDLVRSERDEAKVRLGLRGKTEVSGGVIPDQATIDAIRAKRERLRQAGPAAQDYIALDGGSNHGEAEGLSDEEPEFRGRIGFLGAKIDGGKKGVFDDFEERVMAKDSAVVSGDDEDEEELEKMWEEEQARKGLGLGKRIDDGVSTGVSTSVGASTVNVAQNVHQQKFGYPVAASGSVYSSVQISATDIDGPSIGGAIGGLPGLDAMSISQQAELSKKALYDNLKMLKESHSKTMASLTRNDENLSASLLNVTTLENSLSAAGEKFIFMQKLRDFVSVICDFLQHKAPFIEELEDQMQKLHEERAAAILERRAADNTDEMGELEPAVNAALSVFSKSGSNAGMIKSATSAAQAASIAARELRDLPVELDELGRDMNRQRRMDLTRRAEARQRRKAKSNLKRLSSMDIDSSYQRMEGESSTDESDSESKAYQSNRDQLFQISEQIFSDAAEDYAQLSAVVERLERWKKEYASSYHDAYMSLSAPAIFSPYIRLELLKWDPLHEDSDFIHMKWHSLLFDYGIPEDDADANLIPELVEKLAIPILHHQLAYCWDMLSTRETEYAVSATNLVLGYVPPSSSAIGNLVAALRDRLTDAVANLTVPTWNTLVLKAVPNAARAAAYRFGVSVRLMRNICLWHKVLAKPVLENLALDELLRGKILPHLLSIQSNIHDAVTRTERLVASLDGVWAGPSVTGDHSPKLQPLVDFLLSLGRKLEKRHVSGGIETAQLARRLKKMLVELNEYDQARAISRTFSLKEAL